ncbi:GNAT family N-acetyltransferase [Paenibacillus thermotolerans]|uniref:GNAT family N-acetyltransferase n=1 Tax=Paenibacillus thermotolerans TaxID=3027807 RepID=UPI0023686888|nr:MULTISPECIES: GNAT family N-acetyltransferase [unclassified Paenibacillus]
MDTKKITCRLAMIEDLDKIVYMLADDVLGNKREQYEQPLPENYVRAFQSISADPNNELIVACSDEEVVGVLQITYIPHLTYQGGWRATIEGVRVSSSERGKGIGSQLINWSIERAKERGCKVIQLTTDKKRPEALQFYKTLGFQATHEGLKMYL